jgi:hypothetical protein
MLHVLLLFDNFTSGARQYALSDNESPHFNCFLVSRKNRATANATSSAGL